MKHYTSINDIENINSWIAEAKDLKANPLKNKLILSLENINILKLFLIDAVSIAL